MAESVVKLRVDSGEYESKIKRAAENVRNFGENCKKAGESVSKADKETLEYVQAIGRMDTVSKNARGKINEMTTAFTELSVQYKQLTDQEKQSPFGQALASSLEQLKTRINDSKTQLTEVNAELSNTSAKGDETGGVMQLLANKFTISFDAVKLFNIGLKASEAALGVAKDAFFASEAAVDEWGRTMDASRSLYEGFLSSINNGDISGFLSRINEIIIAARNAYDELDRLGSMRTIQAPQISAQQTENDRIRMMIQTGRYIAPTDGRRPTPGLTNGQILTPDQIRRLEQQLQNGMNKVVTLVGDEVKQTGKAIDAFYTRQSLESGLTEKEFRKGTSSWAEFSKRMEGYEAYNKWNAKAYAEFAKQGGRGSVNFDKSNPYAAYRAWGNFRVDGDRYKELVQLIQQRDQQASQVYSMQGQTYRVINRAEGITTRSIMGGGAGGGGRTGGTGGGTTATQAPPPVGSIAEQEAKVQALTKAWREATDEAGRAGYLGQLEEAKQVLAEMQGKTTDIIPEGSLKDLNNQMKELQKKRELLANPIDISILDDDIKRIKDKIDILNGVVKKETTNTPMSLEEKIRVSVADSITALDETTLTNLMEFKIRNGLENLDINSDYLQHAIFGKRIDIPDEYWHSLEEEINKQLAARNFDPIKIDVNTGEITRQAKTLNKDWMAAASAIQSVGSAMQSIEDPALKVFGTIAQAIASIALGAGEAIEAHARQSGNKWEWIAFAASATATMISSIAAVKSNTKGFEQGGIIPGNRWSGDNLSTADYGINSGELVLTRAQQGNLASQLQGNNSGMELQPYLDVEKIWLGLRHYTNRTGKGEIVTTR